MRKFRKFIKAHAFDLSFLLSLIILPFLGLIVVCSGWFRPNPIVFPSSSPQAETVVSTRASQSIRITLRRPASLQRSHSRNVKTQINKPTDPLENAVIPSCQEEEADEEMVIEMGNLIEATSSATSYCSPPLKEVEETESLFFGVIAGSFPGAVALDYRVIKLGPIGVDLQGNHSEVGVGISIGNKAFGTGGLYQGFNDGRGVYFGAGMRF